MPSYGRHKKYFLPVIAAVLFLFFLKTGLFLASQKPLWIDEVYSQNGVVQGLSYLQIIEGGIREGNNCPLFYILQKIVCDLSPHHMDQKILLRIAPDICMSLTFVLIFYFFAEFYSWGAAAAGLLIALTSPIYDLWHFWAEARPYALWVLLTTCQTLLFLIITRQGQDSRRSWVGMIIIHYLLVLDIAFALPQVFIVSLLLGIFQRPRWLIYINLTVIPMVIGIFYHALAIKSHYWFSSPPSQLIFTCMPPEWFSVMGIYFFLFFVKDHLGASFMLKGQRCAVYLLSMLLMAFSILGVLQSSVTPDKEGFEISYRYFLFLTPVSIICLAVFTFDLIEALRDRPWLRLNMAMVMAGLYVMAFLRYNIWAWKFF